MISAQSREHVLEFIDLALWLHIQVADRHECLTS